MANNQDGILSRYAAQEDQPRCRLFPKQAAGATLGSIPSTFDPLMKFIIQYSLSQQAMNT